MDEAEALLNLQSRRSTRQSKPTKHPDFLYTDADFLDERDLFLQHQSSFTDPSKQEASGGQLFSSVVQPATKPSNKQGKRPKKSHKPDSGQPYEADPKRQLYDLQLHDDQADLLTSPPFYEGLPLPANNSDPQSSSRPAATERDLSQEIQLAQLQKEKLTLELEVLRMRHTSNTASDDPPTQTASGEKSSSRKKRVNDWPPEFAPGNPSDYKIELAEFVTGFLVMIKPYDNPSKSAILEYLELLMTKASSYSWPSVRAFHAHVAKQIELCRLEWTSFTDIRNKAVTFFKHSDLRSSQPQTNPGMVSSTSLVMPPFSCPSTKSEAEKACRQWNYYGSCSCDKFNLESFNAHHNCHVCTKEHPMLHCHKRKNPIPAPNSS